MKALVLLFLVSVAAFSCKDDDNNGTDVCNVSDPARMSWVKVKIRQYQIADIESTMMLYRAQLKSEFGEGYVFWFSSCCSNCSFITEYYNCDGEKIELPLIAHESPFTDAAIMWRGRNFECKLM